MNAVNAVDLEKRDKLFNLRPALFAAIFLIYGVVFAYYRFFYGASAWWSLLLAPLTAVFLFVPKRELLRRCLFVVLLCAFAMTGFIAFRYQLRSYAQAPAFKGSYIVTGTVENRYEYADYTRVVLTDVTIGETEVKGRFNATLPPSFASEITIGARLFLQGEVKTNRSYFNGYGLNTNALYKRIYYSASVSECVNVGRSKNLFLLLRARMERVLYAGMDETPAALSLALLTGDTSGVDGDLMENMRYGGISHIFAVSGLNIGALFAFCLFAFSKTPLRRAPKPLRFFLLTGILFFYTGLCGFTASVVRAAVLCVLGYLVRLLGSRYDLLDSLGGAAIFIVLLSPCQLFDVGFQLSFLACVGLLLLTKPITQVFDECKNALRKCFPRKYTKEEVEMLEKGNTLPVGVGEKAYRATTSLLSASLAAQMATLPVLLLRFNFLSGWSLLLNFIFVPFTDGIFTLLLLLTLAACVLPAAFAPLLLYLPSLLWSAATLIFEWADFSSFALQDVQISFAACVCYYVAITFLSDKWNVSKRTKVWLALLFLAGLGAALYLGNR